jgi:hypothetical protein
VQEEDEVGGVTCGTQLSTSSTRLVQWARVATALDIVSNVDWLKPNYWELNNCLSGCTVLDSGGLHAPLSTFKEESMDIDTVLGNDLNVVLVEWPYICPVLKGIDWSPGLSCVSLKSSSHETLWEEE